MERQPTNLTPHEAAERLRVGRTTIYNLLADGKLPSFRIGRKILIPVEGIRALEGVRK